MSRITRDEMFLEIVEVIAQRATCNRGKVGAVLVREGRIISIGWNGPPAGVEHCNGNTSIQCSDCTHFSFDRMVCTGSIHAEANVIAYAARAGISTEGTTLYCKYSPCYDCAKLLLNSGVVRFVFDERYHDNSGVDLLLSQGMKVHHHGRFRT